MTRRGAVLQAALSMALTLAATATAAATGGYAAGTLDDRIDLLVRAGYEHPAEALAGLAQLRSASGVTLAPALMRDFILAQGIVQAQAGHSQVASVLAARLLSISRAREDPLAGAGSELVRALAAENDGRLDEAAALAQSAAVGYEAGCPRLSVRSSALAASAAGTPVGMNCDYRALWNALQLLQRSALDRGQLQAARDHAQAALDLAERAGDPYLRVHSLGSIAFIAASNRQFDVAQRTLAQAKRMASDLSGPAAMVHVRLNEARLALLRPDADGDLRAAEEVHAMAQRAGVRRRAAVLQVDLSTAYIKRKRFADALRTANEALATIREFHDQPYERMVLKNAGLAKIGLQRIPEGKSDLARVLQLWKQGGEPTGELQTLVDYGHALAAAGDARGAIELFHRERALSAAVVRQSQSAVLKEMQTRYDAEAKQRSIEIISRDTAVKTAMLTNQDRLHRIWLLVAAALTLSVTLAVLLYRRVRVTNRQLEESNAKLRVAGQHDPLTNLANRRHFQAVMHLLHGAPENGFSGALLLVDIDHFKDVNDRHGHAAGDVVLTEVAERLRAAVREGDLIVRWGGEEFLIVATKLTAEQADQLAARVLATVGGAPVVVGAQALRVTVSIGYARFPLPPNKVPVHWEQAVNLSDMALYTAKSQGRNRAIGVVSAEASDAQSLSALEGDFERAWTEGRVTLHSAPGPQAA